MEHRRLDEFGHDGQPLLHGDERHGRGETPPTCKFVRVHPAHEYEGKIGGRVQLCHWVGSIGTIHNVFAECDL